MDATNQAETCSHATHNSEHFDRDVAESVTTPSHISIKGNYYNLKSCVFYEM